MVKPTDLLEPVQHATTTISTLMGRGRLDASAYNLEALDWHETIEKNSHLNLADTKIVDSMSYPPRFRRNYVKPEHGQAFLLPSQIDDLVVRPTKWVTGLPENLTADLAVKSGDLLLTRSGTVGKVALANEQHENAILSDDLIRIRARDGWAEFLFAFLKSRPGRQLVSSNQYGAVIQHVEPHHLEALPVPSFKKSIHDSIVGLVKASEAQKAIAFNKQLEAEEFLTTHFSLPEIHVFHQKSKNTPRAPFITTQRFSNLAQRLDSSFHSPIVQEIENHLLAEGATLRPVRDADLSTAVSLPPRFTRTYARDQSGAPLIGGKSLSALDPRTDKRILSGHLKDTTLDALKVIPGSVLITRSGTVGKVVYCPEHWNEWILSEHIIRVIPSSPSVGAYIAAWLSTPYGRLQIERQIYGSVVDEVDSPQISSILIPFASESVVGKVGSLVQESSSAASKAFALLQEAISILEQNLELQNS